VLDLDHRKRSNLSRLVKATPEFDRFVTATHTQQGHADIPVDQGCSVPAVVASPHARRCANQSETPANSRSESPTDNAALADHLGLAAQPGE
jgi:hypothetical protein